MKTKRPTITVYLIHFAEPFKHAQHYLGSAINLDARLNHHRKGSGAKLLRALNAAGIKYDVVRTWKSKDGRQLEATFKRARHHRQLCSCCKQAIQ